MARYVLLFAARRTIPYARIYSDEPAWARDEPAWARQTGIAQMMLFTAALAPFGGRATRAVVRLATPIVAPLQLAVMVLLYRRLKESVRA
jgi:hypothetical protein